jgi:hypothetical protein
MLFNVVKDLKNKIFYLNVERKYISDDAENIKEAQLEDDFGLVEVETGGLFSGYILKKDDTYTVSLASTGDPDEVELKFSLPTNTVKLTKDIVIKYFCDSTKEAKIKDVSALKVAESKCDLFALEIQKRIEDAVEEWKKQVTDFETKDPTSFEVSLN